MCACEAAPFRDQTCCPGVVVEPHRFKAFNLSSLPFPVDVPPVRSMPQWQGVLVSVVVRLVTACRVASSRIHGSPAHVAGAHLCSPPTWPRAERRGQRWNGIAVRGSRIAPWTMMQYNEFVFVRRVCLSPWLHCIRRCSVDATQGSWPGTPLACSDECMSEPDARTIPW